jgi:hypothetical protein
LPCRILCTNLAPCRKAAGPSAPNDSKPPISANARGRSRWNTVFDRQIGHGFDRQATLNDDGVYPLAHESRKGTFEFVSSAGHHDRLYFRACRVAG